MILTTIIQEANCILFKASGVVVGQQSGSPTPPAFCSRWSQKEILQTLLKRGV